MNKTLNIHFFLIVTFFTILLGFIIFINDQIKIAFLIFLIPFYIYYVITFPQNYKIFLIGSLFIGYYFNWPTRVQSVLLVSISLILFYIAYKKYYFNSFKIPKNLFTIALLLIIWIFASSIESPHFSIKSLYFAFLFFVFIFTSYIVSKSILNIGDINKYFKYLLVCSFVSGIVIILHIFISSNMRAVGFTGFAYIDIAVIALLIVIFREIILGKVRALYVAYLIILVITLITTQSRFAWLGFLLTLIYGIIFTLKNSSEAYAFIKKKLPLTLTILLVVISIIFITGAQELIVKRVTDINFSFFETTDEKEYVIQNSLETRILIWVVAINTFKSNPIFGVGYLMFSEVSETYNVLPQMFYDSVVKGLDAHTTYLNFLTETGIGGLLLFLMYSITIYIFSFKAIKLSNDAESKRNSIVLNILVFFIIIHSIYSGAFTFSQNAFSMHIVFGLTIGNYLFLNNKKKSEAILN